MRPIRAIPNSDAPSDQTGGTPAQIAQSNYGRVPPQCASCLRPAARGHVWARASAPPPLGPVPGSGHGHRPQRPAPAGSRAGRDTGPGTPPQAVVPPGPAARPRFDRPPLPWLRSPRPPAAGRGPHRLRAVLSRTCRDPRGWGPSARPFCCRLLGAIAQPLVPLDPLQSFRALGPLLPRPAPGLLCHPDLEPPLDRVVGRKAGGQPPPPASRHPDREHGRQTRPGVRGRTAVPPPDPRWENRRKEYPHVRGPLPGQVRELPGNPSWRQ